MKVVLVLVCLLAIPSSFSQEVVLCITNLETQKEKVINKNKRIKIKTVSGKKYVGRLQIIDENTIRLRGVYTSLADIEKIKRHSLLGTIGHAFSMSALGVGTLTLATIAADPFYGRGAPKYVSIAGIVLAIGAVYIGTKPINFLSKEYRVDQKWKF